MHKLVRQLTLMVIIFIAIDCSTKETPRPAPKAAFIWANAGQGIVQFTDQSSEADSYLWDFGDGTSASTERNPKHTFGKNARYVVTLTATSAVASSKTSQEIDVSSFESPVASFSVTYGDDGLANFVNMSTNAQSYKWDFGNNTSNTQETPSVKYTENKKYVVSLTAIGKGGEAKATKEIEISNVKPIVDFVWSESNGQVTFTNRSKNADSYSWDFGNGKISTELNPVSRYTKTGSYIVKLTANGKGGEVSKTSTISISYVSLTLADVIDDQGLVDYLPGIWGAYVQGEQRKFNNYVYEFSKLNTTMNYTNYYNDYYTLISPQTTKLTYQFNISDKIIYTNGSNSSSTKYARFQLVSEDEMKFFRIIETATSYTELLPFTLTRTSDVEKNLNTVVSSTSLQNILKGVWDQGVYSIYTDVYFDFSAGKNYYNYNTTFQEAKQIDKYEFKVDANNIMSYRKWNSDFDPSWKKYKVEIASGTMIKLYAIDANGKISSQATYTLRKRT